MSYSYLLASLLFILRMTSIRGTETKSNNQTANEKRLQLLQGSLGLNESPCWSFYNYACGEWHHYISSYAMGNIELLDNKVNAEMENALKQIHIITDYKFLREVNKYFSSCSDNDEPDEHTLNYLKWMNVYEGIPWPLVVGKNSSGIQEYEWLQLLALTRKYGFNEIFFHEDVIQVPEDPFKWAIKFERPSLKPLTEFESQIFKFKNLLDDKEVEKFSAFQMDLAKLIVNLVEKQEGFASLLATPEKPNKYETTATTLGELKMPWLEQYLSALLNQTQLDANMVVHVQNATHLQMVYEFLSKYDNRFLCDYIQIKFLIFLQQSDGILKRGDCVQSARDLFPLALQWMYKRTHFPLQQEIPIVQHIFSNLKHKFKKTLSTSVYNFTQDVVEYLQAKVDSLHLSIDEASADELESYYETLTLSQSDYYGNRLRLNRFHFSKSHSLLSYSSLKGKLSTAEIHHLRIEDSYENADTRLALSNLPYLIPRFNIIGLPLTLLEHPYYESCMIDLYRYSTIGYLLGRQIFTAFDKDNLQINALGIYQNVMRRQMLSNEKFAKSLRNLEKDFSSESGFQKKGAIADLGGLKLAFDTLAELHPNFEKETVTIQDQTTITKDKLFFLSFAQNYCSTICGFSAFSTTFYDECDHVSKPVQHLATFRDAFGCTFNKVLDPLWRE